jgi:hypothetical protein
MYFLKPLEAPLEGVGEAQPALFRVPELVSYQLKGHISRRRVPLDRPALA